MFTNLFFIRPKIWQLLFSRYRLLLNQLFFFRNLIPGWIKICAIRHYTLFFFIDPSVISKIFFFLSRHTACLYEQVRDICAVDMLRSSKNKRFWIVYQLLSLKYNSHLTCHVELAGTQLMPSISFLYPAAAWFECEIWDLFGIFFENHETLHRLLTDYGFKGYPFRKDFPLSGYTELFYNESKKKIGYYKISAVQEFRNYVFLNPWA